MLKINLSLSSDEPDEYTIMKLRNSLKLMLKNDQTSEAEYLILVNSSTITRFCYHYESLFSAVMQPSKQS